MQTLAPILVVAAHPDDEVLGCGGTIAKHAAQGHAVHIAFLADGVSSRSKDHTVETVALNRRRQSAQEACKVLGAQPPLFGDFPDNQLDTIPLLQITQTIEQWIEQLKPTTVFTHHSGDVNIDHQRIHQAVITACRPQKVCPVRTILFFEVPSSTEWQIPESAPHFSPNWFEDISGTFEKKKLALQCYAQELRQWPHPRSIEGVEALARWRGATVGADAGEAFMLGRKIG